MRIGWHIFLLAVTTLTIVAGCATGQPGASVGESKELPQSIWVVGDSITVGASDLLEEELPGVEINAEVGRTFSQGLVALGGKLQTESPPDLLIVALGTNNGATTEDIQQLLTIGSSIPEIALVNIVVPRAWEQDTNTVFLEAAAENPKVVFIDWRAAADHDEALFRQDGFHPNLIGLQAWVDTITDGLDL